MTASGGSVPTETLDAHAEEVHRRALVFNALVGSGAVPATPDADFTLPPIMHAGGVTGVNLTVALRGGFAETARRMVRTSGVIDRLAAGGEDVRVARTTADLREAKASGGSAIVFGFQNGGPIEDEVEHLTAFYELGLRILQLTYQRRNLIADGCGEPADAGLSTFGRAVVAEANRLGVLIDLSHVNARATRETIEESAHPVSFTHVNLTAYHPVPRNKSDEEIRALAARGGVVGINAVARLLSPRGRERGATIDEFLDQVDHVAELVGPEHVGLGLDINEGMTEEQFMARRQGFLREFPELRFGGDFAFEHYYVTGLDSMAHLRRITAGLLARGWSDDDVVGVLGGNFMRLLDVVWGDA